MSSRLPTILAALLLVVGLADAKAELEPLDSIARIRALSPEDAARGLPARIEAVVTFYFPSRRDLLVHDGRAGIYVMLPLDTSQLPEVRQGDRVRVEGVTGAGGFLPMLHCTRLERLGEGSLPTPRAITAGELYSPPLDCQWVEASAIPTGIDSGRGIFPLVLELGGTTVVAEIADPGEPDDVARLMQRPVTVRGVLATVNNSDRQLTGRFFFLQSIRQIISPEASSPAAEASRIAVSDLLRSQTTLGSRVRIVGIVTAVMEGALYLRGTGGSLLIRAANVDHLAPGDEVEAEGYPGVAPFRPVLRATLVRLLKHGPPPQPVPLDLAREKLFGQHAELVSVEAEMLGRRDGPTGEGVWHCRAGNWFFEAIVPANAQAPLRLQPNAVVRLVGICELTTSHSLPRAEWVDGFRLHVRSAADIRILRFPAWWTVRRALSALAVVGVVALGLLAGTALLRRRVASQAKIIAAQTERATVRGERQRIARELHDTLEQELAGLSIQLRNARRLLADDPAQAESTLGFAQLVLRRCREEAHTSIRDLRSVTLELRGLSGALDDLLRPISATCGARFVLQIAGVPRSLPGAMEIHLLRIAHQAVTNAAQHAAPREISVRLSYEDHAVSLEIRDDGRGFDPSAEPPRGHFGLLGIRERANKLKARLDIESAPRAGTRIRLVAPVESAALTAASA